MRKLYSFFLSEILYKKVYNQNNEYIGKLWDIYVANSDTVPIAIGYKLKADGKLMDCRFNTLDLYKDHNTVRLRATGINNCIPQNYSYLLSKQLLDKQIVDINGKKIVRVNDLRLTKLKGEIKVIAVDCGMLSLSRRLGIEGFVKVILKLLKKRPSDNLIMWDNIQPLEIFNSSLKLSVAYNKLTKLHPADLADIVEDMGNKYMKIFFESLDESLAAYTLEELEPRVQIKLLENLSQSKTAEILDTMPSDEVADLLDEMDENTAEKILMSLEKKDAEIVKSLMEYDDETAGSLMNKDYISYNINITAQETMDLLREVKPEEEVSHNIYITDKNGTLKGVLSLRDLVVSSPDRRLEDIMDSETISVLDEDDLALVIETLLKYNLTSVPVVNKKNKLCGMVILNDVLDEAFLPLLRRK